MSKTKTMMRKKAHSHQKKKQLLHNSFSSALFVLEILSEIVFFYYCSKLLAYLGNNIRMTTTLSSLTSLFFLPACFRQQTCLFSLPLSPLACRRAVRFLLYVLYLYGRFFLFLSLDVIKINGSVNGNDTIGISSKLDSCVP